MQLEQGATKILFNYQSYVLCLCKSLKWRARSAKDSSWTGIAECIQLHSGQTSPTLSLALPLLHKTKAALSVASLKCLKVEVIDDPTQIRLKFLR